MLAELGIEPLERFEEVPLLRVVHGLAEVPVPHGRQRRPPAVRRAPPPQGRATTKQRAIERAWITPSLGAACAAHHSPSSIALGPFSAIPSSFGSIPLANENVSVLLKSSPLGVLPLIETAISWPPVGRLPV